MLTSIKTTGAKMEMTESARNLYEGIQNLVRKRVISNERLIGMPAEDLFVKQSYMMQGNFWNDPYNVAQQSRALYITGDKYVPSYREAEIVLDDVKVATVSKCYDSDLKTDVVRVVDNATGIKTILADDRSAKYPILKVTMNHKSNEVPRVGLNEAAKNIIKRNRANADVPQII